MVSVPNPSPYKVLLSLNSRAFREDTSFHNITHFITIKHIHHSKRTAILVHFTPMQNYHHSNHTFCRVGVHDVSPFDTVSCHLDVAHETKYCSPRQVSLG
jgi:hypothetical protein